MLAKLSDKSLRNILEISKEIFEGAHTKSAGGVFDAVAREFSKEN